MSKLIPQLEAASMTGICKQNLSVGRHGGTAMKKVKIKNLVFYHDHDIHNLINERHKIKLEKRSRKCARRIARDDENEAAQRVKILRRKSTKFYLIKRTGTRYIVLYGKNVAASCKNEADANDYVMLQLHKGAPRHPIFT